MTSLCFDFDAATKHAIMEDLMSKVGDDVEAAICRVLQIAPRPFLPLVLSAATVAMISLIGEIDNLNNSPDPARRMTEPQVAMLAALIVGRTITERNVSRALDEANADMQALKHAARMPR